MLKITTINDDGGERVVKLEGKLLADWIGELHDACRAAGFSGCLRLDLSGLSFADVAGTIALRELMRQGASIANTSPFVRELLERI